MPMSTTELHKALRGLRLSGMSATLEARALQITTEHRDFLEGLSWLVQDELDRRRSRLLERRFTHSGLPERKSLQDLDWSYNPKLPKREIFELTTLKFLDAKENVLLIGKPGTGKSHAAKALALIAIESRLPRLLSRSARTDRRNPRSPTARRDHQVPPGFARLNYVDPRPARTLSHWDAAEASSIYNFNLTVMEASLKFVLNATPTLIHNHNQSLINYLFERLPDGYGLASPRQASQRGVFGCIEVGSDRNTESLYQTLRDEQFVVALREGKIRVALHLLNSTQDINRLLVSLAKARNGVTHVEH